MKDKQLIRIAADMRRGILGMRSPVSMCMAVSAPLQGYLAALCNFQTEIEEIDLGDANHVWLRLPDGRILDATADQFGLPPIFLGQEEEWYAQRLAHFVFPATPPPSAGSDA